MPVADQPSFSPTVLAAFGRAHEVSAWIAANLPKGVTATKPAERLAAPYFFICIDHRGAILLLLEHDRRSAAFALWRSVYESRMRGLWALFCANDQDVEAIVKRRTLPSLERMIRRLDSV